MLEIICTATSVFPVPGGPTTWENRKKKKAQTTQSIVYCFLFNVLFIRTSSAFIYGTFTDETEIKNLHWASVVTSSFTNGYRLCCPHENMKTEIWVDSYMRIKAICKDINVSKCPKKRIYMMYHEQVKWDGDVSKIRTSPNSYNQVSFSLLINDLPW